MCCVHIGQMLDGNAAGLVLWRRESEGSELLRVWMSSLCWAWSLVVASEFLSI